jgi:hypothetical protein
MMLRRLNLSFNAPATGDVMTCGNTCITKAKAMDVADPVAWITKLKTATE